MLSLPPSFPYRIRLAGRHTEGRLNGVVDPQIAVVWHLEEGTTILTPSVALPFAILFFLLLATSQNP